MREITTHKGNGCNDALNVVAIDEPGIGGSCHHYLIESPACVDARAAVHADIVFQNGPILEDGTNGVTHESLLAILIDRLAGFQSGPYACDENQAALNFCKCALGALQQRTTARLARGVEGTHAI